METVLKTFTGNSFLYTEIAENEQGVKLGVNMFVTLGLKTQQPTLLLRFVSYFPDYVKPEFKFLEVRDYTTFITGENSVSGVRLSRFALPLFDGVVPPSQLLEYGDKFGIWESISNWIISIVYAEGFKFIIPSTLTFVRDHFLAKPIDSSIKSVLEIPDLLTEKK